MNIELAFVESGRSPGRVDTAIIYVGCIDEECEVKIEHVVDLAAVFAIFQAHQMTHSSELKDARALASIFGPDGQPIAGHKRPGLLDT